MLVSAFLHCAAKGLVTRQVFTFHSLYCWSFSREREAGCDVHWFPVFHCSLQFHCVILSELSRREDAFSAPAEARCLSVIYQL